MHKPGKTNTVADALTRVGSKEVLDREDNHEVVVLPETLFAVAATQFENPLTGEIRDALERDAEVIEGLKSIKDKGLRRLIDGTVEWEVESGLIYHKGKVYVPARLELRRKLLAQVHDHQTAGHPGYHGTLELLSRNYWWPGMAQFVSAYVKGCEVCGRAKADN